MAAAATAERQMPKHVDVLVVGAGIGGLCAAARLAAAGRRPLLVERVDRVGGRASSFQKSGYTINTGAVAVELGGALEQTFHDVGAELPLRCPEPANVFRIKGRTIDPAKGGWAFLLDQITKKGAKLLAGLGGARAGEYPEDQVTLEQWIGRATGNRTVHRLFRNLAAAIFAVNADEIPARAFLTYFMEKGAFRRFGFHPEGTIGVCRALSDVVERYGGQVWLQSEVLAIHSDGRTATGASIRRGDLELELTCEAVVCDVGPEATIALAGGRALGDRYVRCIGRLARPTANIIIHIGSEEPLLDTPGLIVFSETERVCNAGNMTATCPELAPAGKHLTVVYAVPRPAVGDFDQEREVELSLAELRAELPGVVDAEILDVRVMRGDWPAQRALAGYEMPRQTPLENLWNVGDGVRDYGSGGMQACAETARDVAYALISRGEPMSATATSRAAADASSSESTTLCAAFQATVAAHPDLVALRSADGKTELTFAEYAKRVRRIAAGLSALGVRRGDRVALMLSNRPEFHLIDTATVHLGATPFSVYATSSEEQIAYLLQNAGNELVVVEEQFFERVTAARGDREQPSSIVCVDGALKDTITLESLEALGAADFDFEAAWRAVEPGDVLTLIYTSGTTGPPKGVELTHANMLAQCRAVAKRLPMRAGARMTSYLPAAHIADRWSCHYNSMVFGIQVTSVPDARQIASVLRDVRPTIWGAVPRVVEKLKAALEAGLAAEPDQARRSAVQRALELAREKVRLEQAGEPVPAELAAAVAEADRQVLGALREKIGLDQAEWVVIGAAPMPRAVHEFLLALGLPVTETFGMSECSCCVTISSPSDARIGSVGRAIDCVELALADDGELLVRGETVMKGYRGQPEKTAEAIDEHGWMHTGDICTIEDGYVRIVDRKKELIINAAGKNMSPANIEQELKSADPLIGQAAVIGDARPYNVALLVLDPDIATATAQALGLQDSAVGSVASDPRVLDRVAKAVAAANARLARVEQIKRYELLPAEWLPGGEELTPTMKLKRRPIAAKYGAIIDGLYAR
jgi:long-subunit acyl-CoA synthetase (AMP-forming)/phytoene dehydrogenase-like protein